MRARPSELPFDRAQRAVSEEEAHAPPSWEGREEESHGPPSLEREKRTCKALFTEAGPDGNLKGLPTETEFNTCKKGYKYRFGFGLGVKCSVCTNSLDSISASITKGGDDAVRSRCSHHCGKGSATANALALGDIGHLRRLRKRVSDRQREQDRIVRRKAEEDRIVRQKAEQIEKDRTAVQNFLKEQRATYHSIYAAITALRDALDVYGAGNRYGHPDALSANDLANDLEMLDAALGRAIAVVKNQVKNPLPPDQFFLSYPEAKSEAESGRRAIVRCPPLDPFRVNAHLVSAPCTGRRSKAT